MNPLEAKHAADSLIANANRIARAKLEAAGEECARTKKRTVAANKAKDKLPYCHIHERKLDVSTAGLPYCALCLHFARALKDTEGTGA